jgi:hypothetical protein
LWTFHKFGMIFRIRRFTGERERSQNLQTNHHHPLTHENPWNLHKYDSQKIFIILLLIDSWRCRFNDDPFCAGSAFESGISIAAMSFP